MISYAVICLYEYFRPVPVEPAQAERLKADGVPVFEKKRQAHAAARNMNLKLRPSTP
jgi:hypothetical protein